jgi:hypothetical protein
MCGESLWMDKGFVPRKQKTSMNRSCKEKFAGSMDRQQFCSQQNSLGQPAFVNFL